MSQQEIIQLLDRYLAGTATLPEQERVDAWLNSNEDLNNDWEQMDETQRTDFLTNLYQRILSTIQEPGVVVDRPQADVRTSPHGVSRSGPRVVRMYWKWIAAACIIALVGVLANVWLRERSQLTGNRSQVAVSHDVSAPKETRAVITLANGSKVYLDSVDNGTIAQENNVAVVKNQQGEIVYNPSVTLSGVEASTVKYNTLSNPRGSKVISLTLSDGTRVWLNSESSLRYPAAFAGNTREVEITGEAYFEVRHNAKQPFKVHLPNGSIVEDIGTSFNVNAYTDEESIKTTLIEGKVRLSPAGAKAGKVSPTGGDLEGAVTLKPGQQASIVYSSTPLRVTEKAIKVTNDINLAQILSWKENKFYFDGADIHTIARQLSRWYNVDVEIKDNIPSHFTGVISRDVNVSQVFDMLQKTGAVKFSVEGKKIIVMK